MPTPSRFSRASFTIGLLAVPASPWCGALCAQSQVQFSDATASSSVNFVHTDVADTMAGGVCLFDFDNDGWVDLFATARAGGSNRLFRNQRNGTFSDVTAAAGVGGAVQSTGAFAADLDNDGWQDLVVTRVGGLILHRNNGNGTFTNVTAGSGLVDDAWATALSFGDYNRDGRLDIYVGNYIIDGFFPYFRGSGNLLFRNNGNMRFTDVTATAGVSTLGNFRDPRGGPEPIYAVTLSALFFDFDSDGWPDILVGNDFGAFVIANLLYRNNGNGTFSQVSVPTGFDIPEFNMGLATGDVNGDGILDVYTTNLGDNHLLLNDGARFRDVAPEWGATEGRMNGLLLTSWACMFMDADLDGRSDLYVSNGYIQTIPAWANEPFAPKHLLQNLGTSYRVLPPAQFPLDTAVGRGAARADLDNDGDEDVVQLNNRSALKIYRNDSPRAHTALILELQGTVSNRDGIGSFLTVRSGQRTQVWENNRGGSYMSCNAAPILLGLGNDSQANRVSVRWPSGITSSRFGLAGNQRHALVEPSVTIVSVGAPVAIGPEFIEVPVTVRNHVAATERVDFTAGLVYQDIRFPYTSYSLPANLAPNATTTLPIYLPIPYVLLPFARQLGIGLQVSATSRTNGLDQAETAF